MKQVISAIKAKLFSQSKGDKNNIPVKDMCLLDHIEKTEEISRKYGINKCLVKGKLHLDYVSSKLGIGHIQTVLFSHFMARCNDSHILMSEIAGAVNCSLIRIIKYMNECEELEKKKLIRCRRDKDGVSYRVPREVYDSLRKNNEYIPVKHENLSVQKLFKIFKRIFVEVKEKELSYDNMKLELFDLIHLNKHLLFCQKITNYKLDEDELILLLCFCNLFGNNNDDYIVASDFEFLLDSDTSIYGIEDFRIGIHPLIEAKYIEHTSSNGFINSDSCKLSDMTKKELMTELPKSKNYQNNLISFDTVKPKKMFYNHR